MLSGSSRTHRWRSSPAHSWTPTMPKMKKTKKHSNRTLPSIGSVSSSSITRIRRSANDNNFIARYAEPPYSRTKIYAARVSYAANDAHRLPLHGFAAAARAALGQTDRRTDG